MRVSAVLVVAHALALASACDKDVILGTRPQDGAVGSDAALPPIVCAASTTVASLALGMRHGCAIRTDGSLWCWGMNTSGQVGQGTTSMAVLVPSRVGVDTSWAAVSAGEAFNCATHVDQSLACWGDNATGQLGVGDIAIRTSPVAVAIDGVAQVSAGDYHACAIRTDGSLWCWGLNTSGQLGLGDSGIGTDRTMPERVGRDTDWAHVSAGRYFTCARKTAGSISCWGDNLQGQLGQGDTVSRAAPASIMSSEVWSDLAACSKHVCATRPGGALACWGDNARGQLGVGDLINRLTPADVAAGTLWRSVAGGVRHTCGVQADGSLWCWGRNADGQLGVAGEVGLTESPIVVSTSGWQTTWAGQENSCALSSSGQTWCWGYNVDGALGQGAGADRQSPVPTCVGE